MGAHAQAEAFTGLEPALVAEFEAAAGEEQRPAVDVIRELMASYIEQIAMRQAPPVVPVPESREWRDQVAKEAIATLGLEGLHFTNEERANINRFVDGEIDLDQLRRIWDAQTGR